MSASWIMSTILDHIPLWLSLTICGAIAIVALYFLSPILIPIWRALPTPVKVGLGTALAVVIAILGGRYKGAKDERDKQAARDAQSIQKRTEVDHEVTNLSEKQTSDRLRDRWSRD
jgi:membrane protein implicated in regulation of membrane protease activity